MKRKIEEVQHGFKWSVVELHHDLPVIRIFSDPVSKSHVIKVPDKQSNRSTPLECLYKLGDDVLCEHVHPVFAGNCNFVDRKEDQRQYLAIIPALNVATDWFIVKRLIEHAPQQVQELLEEHIKLVQVIVKYQQQPPVEVILDAALVIAQATHYLRKRTDCSGVMQAAVDALLATPPAEPPDEACCRLVNTLIAIYTSHRARLVNDGGLDLWEAYLLHQLATEVITSS